jgi:GcrA cell cycle regulator
MKYRNQFGAETVWTDDLVAHGLSAAQIAAQLGGGMSRNAVLEKFHRLDLCRREPRSRRIKHRPRRRHGFKSAPAFIASQLPCQPVIPVEPLHIAFADLEPSHCRWPYGDGPFTFCGHWASSDQSYCAHHQAATLRKLGPQFGPSCPIREAE